MKKRKKDKSIKIKEGFKEVLKKLVTPKKKAPKNGAF